MRRSRIPSGVVRTRSNQRLSSAVFLVEPDQLDQVLDSKVGEGLDADFSDTIDPDGGPQVIQSVATSRSLFVFAEVLGETIDGGDVMNLVDVMIMELERRSQRSDATSKGASCQR